MEITGVGPYVVIFNTSDDIHNPEIKMMRCQLSITFELFIREIIKNIPWVTIYFIGHLDREYEYVPTDKPTDICLRIKK